jgi:sporulation protein YlmC with PRC-barrel domain
MEFVDEVQREEKNLNVVDDLIGQEVIDGTGKLLGTVKDIVWDFNVNRIEALVIEERGEGFLSRIGSGEKQYIVYERVNAIGDKVLIDADESSSQLDLESYRLGI